MCTRGVYNCHRSPCDSYIRDCKLWQFGGEWRHWWHIMTHYDTLWHIDDTLMTCCHDFVMTDDQAMLNNKNHGSSDFML